MRVKFTNYGEESILAKLGKVYDVIDEDKDMYLIMGDKGKERSFFKSRFEIVSDPIKVKQWSDLEGLTSKDKYGNYTKIKGVRGNCINTQTYNSKSQYTTKYICTSLDKEHVLEELAMCGFDVEYVENSNVNKGLFYSTSVDTENNIITVDGTSASGKDFKLSITKNKDGCVNFNGKSPLHYYDRGYFTGGEWQYLERQLKAHQYILGHTT